MSLTRFVTEDGDAYAIYYIRFSADHANAPALATVSVGAWGEGSLPNQRAAFALELRQDGVRVLDSADSPWVDAVLIGKTLGREAALAHERIKDVFHITDHIYVEDTEFMEFLKQMKTAKMN